METYVKDRNLYYEAQLTNYGDRQSSVLVRHRILDRDGQVVMSTDWENVCVDAGAQVTVSGNLPWGCRT